MSKVTKSYLITCPSCHGNGWVSQTGSYTSSTQKVCPACSGSGTVVATEESEVTNEA